MKKLIFSIIVFCACVALAGLVLVFQTVSQNVNVSHTRLYTVEKGEYARQVIYDLNESGVITRPLFWRIYLRLNPEYATFRSGTYEIEPGMTGRELLEMLSEGREKQFSITLVEGLTWKEWKQQLQFAPYLTNDLGDDKELLAQINPVDGATSLEGILLADTYSYTAGTTVSDIVERAHDAMRTYLNTAWEQRQTDIPVATPYEALILASIIEKETGLASERPLIAGVFVNRLRQNMRLQTDPTIIYGMGDAFDGDIRTKDKYEPTPYNTYVIKGLPPTPIAMVGRNAIDAALHPEATDAIYFVSKGDGSHHFSVTLAEHNKAVRKYILNQN